MLANYYQENIERLQKNLVKDTKILKRKGEKKKSNNMVVKVKKSFRR